MLIEKIITHGTREELLDKIDRYSTVKEFRREILYIHDDKVVQRVVYISTGLTKKTGKRYYRFDTEATYVYKVKNTQGKPFLYCYKISKRGVREDIPPMVSRYGTWDRMLAESVFGLCLLKIGPLPSHVPAHLALKYYEKPLTMYQSRIFFVSRHKKLRGISARTSTVKDMAKKMFGDHCRKDLIKALAISSDFDKFMAVSELGEKPWEVLGDDLLIDFLRTRIHAPYALDLVVNYLRAFELIPPVHHRKFLLADHLNSSADTLRMVAQIDGRVEISFKGSIDDIHERARRAMRLVRERDYLDPFTHDPEILALEEHGFQLPETPKQLAEWSDEYANCSRSYSGYIRSKQTNVFIYPKYKAMIEVEQGGSLRQVLGKHNSSLEPHEYWEICDKLTEAGIINTSEADMERDRVWGFRPREALAMA